MSRSTTVRRSTSFAGPLSTVAAATLLLVLTSFVAQRDAVVRSFSPPLFASLGRRRGGRDTVAPLFGAVAPQVFGTGSSVATDLSTAVNEAAQRALSRVPPSSSRIDLAWVTVSSLYDNGPVPLTAVVPTLLATVGVPVTRVVGVTAGGVVGYDHDAGVVVESEGATPAVSVTLACLPDVETTVFFVDEDDVPETEDGPAASPEVFRRAVGLPRDWTDDDDDDDDDSALFWLLPHPSFQPRLSDLTRGLSRAHPGSTVFGGLASTVSALTRARLFVYSEDGDLEGGSTVRASGCVGLAWKGDVVARVLTAQGAKPVGGVYRVAAGEESTIRAVVADDDDENDASPRTPRPVLAEANAVLKSGALSDDAAASMRRALLLGLERPNVGGGATFSELERLREGRGHSYLVRQVASAGMRDGSVTFPLGSVQVRRNMRVRFFVRESDHCREELAALWTGHARRTLEQSFSSSSDDDDDKKEPPFVPTACLMTATLDRGTKLFGPNYSEGAEASRYLPGVTSISGFYSNGVLSGLDGAFYDGDGDGEEVLLHGSGACYVLFGSKTERPIYRPGGEEDAADDAAKDDSATSAAKVTADAAPRDEHGELVLRRREVHSGRSMTVSTVEWSVAENMAKPTSVLEGFMWDKETEVDRLRERVPLANLLSQVRALPPRDADRPGLVAAARAAGGLVVVPECKRADPADASPSRPRYDAAAVARSFVDGAGARAVAVHCDATLFGAGADDLRAVVDDVGADAAVLACDLVLYPYQLYRQRLAGADATYLTAGALAAKDTAYLVKIARSVGLATVLSVSSVRRAEELASSGALDALDCLVVSNRDLETYGHDDDGEAALRLLNSDAVRKLKERRPELLLLVEGRVGTIGGGKDYVDRLREAGAEGAIVGDALARIDPDDGGSALRTLRDRLDGGGDVDVVDDGGPTVFG